MTKLKRLLCLIIALSCITVMFAACHKQPEGEEDVTYTVTVKDPLGNAYPSGIIVKFFSNGEQKAMQSCDANGVAAKALPAGDYTVELAFTDAAEGYYYESNITLTKTENEAEVVLSRRITSEPQILGVQNNEYEAYSLPTGCTYVELTAEHRNYVLFVPTEAGNYKISVINGSNTQIGYYGSPHFIQEQSVAEVTDNSFTVSVSASMIGNSEGGTSIYVVGIDALDANTKNCVVAIERIGEPLKTIEDTPWTIYEATAELSAYTLPEGYEIKEFDLTADTDAYNLVFNNDDGFYHLDSKDGPLVLVRLTEDNDYIACFQTILDRSGVSKYFFDENEELVKKESYSECLLEYFEYVDEDEGVYPLTEDLKYIIQSRGEYVGWWDITSGGYLFKDMDGNNMSDINSEIAWLLMCCYIE